MPLNSSGGKIMVSFGNNCDHFRKRFVSMKNKKTIYFYPLMIAAIMGLFYFVIVPALTAPAVEEITYDKFRNMLAAGEIEEVEISTYQITIKPKAQSDSYSKKYYKTGRLLVNDTTIVDDLEKAGVTYGSPIQSDSTFMEALMYIILPTLLTGGIIFFLMRNMTKKMGGGVMSFGKNTGKLYAEKSTGKTFADVAGQDEAKQALVEIIDFLNYPAKYTAVPSCPRALCWWAPREQVRHCWPKQLQEKPKFPSSLYQVPNL